MIALISALSQLLISYFDQEPCDSQKSAVVSPSIFVVEEDWLQRAATDRPICPVIELSQTINAIPLFALIQNLLGWGRSKLLRGS